MNKIQFLNTSYLPATLEEQLFHQDQHQENRMDFGSCSPTPTFMLSDQLDHQPYQANLEIEIEDNCKYSYTEEFDPLELYMQELYQQISIIQIQEQELQNYQAHNPYNPFIQPITLNPPVLQKRLVSFGLQSIQEKDEDLEIVVDSEDDDSDDSEESEDIE